MSKGLSWVAVYRLTYYQVVDFDLWCERKCQRKVKLQYALKYACWYIINIWLLSVVFHKRVYRGNCFTMKHITYPLFNFFFSRFFLLVPLCLGHGSRVEEVVWHGKVDSWWDVLSSWKRGTNAAAQQRYHLQDGFLRFLFPCVLLICSCCATVASEDIFWEEEAALNSYDLRTVVCVCGFFFFSFFMLLCRSSAGVHSHGFLFWIFIWG